MNDQAIWWVILGGLSVLVTNKLGGWIGVRFRRWVFRRRERAIKLLMEQYGGKVLRHRPTGEVGYCVMAAFERHPKLSWLKVRPIAEIIVCGGCAASIQSGMGMMGLLIARAAGHSKFVPIKELVAALPDEVARFKTAKEEPEES